MNIFVVNIDDNLWMLDMADVARSYILGADKAVTCISNDREYRFLFDSGLVGLQEMLRRVVRVFKNEASEV